MSYPEFPIDPDNSTHGKVDQEIPKFNELPSSLRQGFRDYIDYTGFAPPASTDPIKVVENYAQYSTGDYKLMLGRLVQRSVYNNPKTGELESDLDVLVNQAAIVDSFQISALIPTGPVQNANLFSNGVENVISFNTDRPVNAFINTVEIPATSAEEVELIHRELFSFDREERINLDAFYIEVPSDRNTFEILNEISRYRSSWFFAKFRTGGPTPPSSKQTADFMIKSTELGLGYKLTGRLHGLLAHTVSEIDLNGQRREIKESGYLNVLIASILAEEVTRGKIDPSLVEQVLQEENVGAFKIGDSGISWNGQFIHRGSLGRSRTTLHSIGSCSFDEPVEGLAQLRTS